MKQAMKATKNNFKKATKIASRANPKTKSRIGKVKALHRKPLDVLESQFGE